MTSASDVFQTQLNQSWYQQGFVFPGCHPARLGRKDLPVIQVIEDDGHGDHPGLPALGVEVVENVFPVIVGSRMLPPHFPWKRTPAKLASLRISVAGG